MTIKEDLQKAGARPAALPEGEGFALHLPTGQVALVLDGRVFVEAEVSELPNPTAGELRLLDDLVDAGHDAHLDMVEVPGAGEVLSVRVSREGITVYLWWDEEAAGWAFTQEGRVTGSFEDYDLEHLLTNPVR